MSMYSKELHFFKWCYHSCTDSSKIWTWNASHLIIVLLHIFCKN